MLSARLELLQHSLWRDKVNGFLIAAGLLALLTSGVHIFLGGRDVARPLLEARLEDEIKYTLYACWHFASIFFVLSSALFLLGGLGTVNLGATVVASASSLYIVFGLIFLNVKYFVSEPGGLSRLPQWILLTPVGILGLLGLV